MATIFMNQIKFNETKSIITIGFYIGKIKQPIKSYIVLNNAGRFPPEWHNDMITLRNSILAGNVK